jgi:hypothetical protein
MQSTPTFIGPQRAGTAAALEAERTGRARFGGARALRAYPHVIHEPSCSVDHRSSWGYRVTCTGCGAVDACTVGSRRMPRARSHGRTASAGRPRRTSIPAAVSWTPGT